MSNYAKLGKSSASVLLTLVALVGAPACGSDSATDPGTGTQTLAVQGTMTRNADDDTASLHVNVQRAGVRVDDAMVTVHSERGDVTLTHDGSGDYVGVQAGWAGSYRLEVAAGADRLEGSIRAPELMTLLSPDPTTAIDAHAAVNGVVTLRWSGEAADSIRVRSKDFDYEGTDEGHVDMAAAQLKESSQEVELRRENSVALAGGVPGSTLSASCRGNFTLIVVNPF
jgi:phage tail sheath gpL-like